MSATNLALRDTSTMIGRSVRRSTREIDTLLLSILLPVMVMALFVYVFGGAITPEGGYVDYVVPGVILLCAGYGAAQTAVAVAGDMAEGIVDRFRTLPILPSSVLVGHVVASLARNTVSTVCVVGVAYAVGFRPTAGSLEWLAAAGVVLLFVLGFSWLSVCVGLVAGSAESASGFTFFVLFLPYVSSAFVPTETMPRALHAFAEHQPVTPVIETLRGLLMGTPNDAAWLAVAWCAGLAVVGAVGAAVLFGRRGRAR
ncbi:ABC transporter permease [Actinotalea sp. K2]|uniref:ABC transporter permease n=1 Tax=Actinotalea sp. K2 TaxID=2939438 RepID=UPI00201769B7|nr:ABC transporter permease [Actinotalea sp. K2]MCL3860931.1 ABC transporter permease [Actinotalea sp. K2]